MNEFNEFQFAHKWAIDNFTFHRNTNDLFVYSENFSSYDQIEAYIEVLPNGQDEHSSGGSQFVGAFCTFESYLEDKILIEFQMSIVYGDGQLCYNKVSQQILDKCGRWGWPDYIEKDHLLNTKNGLLVGDTLQIYCEVKLNKIESNIPRCINFPLKSSTTDMHAKVISFAYKWTIDNFVSIPNNGRNEIVNILSPIFSISSNDNTKYNFNLNLRNTTHDYLSIFLTYLCTSKPDCVNAHYKLSLLDDDMHKQVTMGCQHKFNRSRSNDFGWHIIHLDKLFDPEKRLLRDLKIYCEIEIFEDVDFDKNSIETNKNVPNVSRSESVCYLYSEYKIMDSVSHKWTIDNFSRFYKHKDLHAKLSTRYFCSNVNRYKFNMKLFPENIIRIVLHFLKQFELKLAVNLIARMSVIDQSDNKCLTQTIRRPARRNALETSIEFNFIYLALQEFENRFFPNDRLTFYLEADIIEYTNEISLQPLTCKPDVCWNKRQLQGSYKAQHTFKFGHKWTIDNFSSLWTSNHFTKEDYICSEKIEIVETNDLHANFAFRLYFNGQGADVNSGHMSLVMKHYKCDHTSSSLHFQCIMEVYSANEQISYLKTIQDKASPHCSEIKVLNRFISIDYLKDPANGFLQNDQLKLFFEVCAIEETGEDDDVFYEDLNYYFEKLEAEPLNRDCVSETKMDASANIFHIDYRWTINKFSTLVDYENKAYYEDIHPNFKSNLYSTKQLQKDNRFERKYIDNLKYFKFANDTFLVHVHLYFRNQYHEKHELVCNVCSVNKAHVTLSYKLGFTTWNDQDVIVLDGRKKFGENDKFEFVIPHTFLTDPDSELLVDDKLNLICQFEITEEKDFTEESLNSKMNLIDVKQTSCTFTQMNQIVHWWFLENFLYQLKSSESDRDIYSNVFAFPLNDKFKFQLIIRPENPDITTNEKYLTIWLKTLGIAHDHEDIIMNYNFSIVDANSKFHYTIGGSAPFKMTHNNIGNKLVKASEFVDFRNKLLVNGNLVILCNLYLLENVIEPTKLRNSQDRLAAATFDKPWICQRMSQIALTIFSSTKMPVYKGACKLTIDNTEQFLAQSSSSTNQFIESEIFSVHNFEEAQFVARIYSRNDKFEQDSEKKQLVTSVCLELLAQNTIEIFVRTTISNENQTTLHSKVWQKPFICADSIEMYECFPLHCLVDFENGSFFNKITVRFEIAVIERIKTEPQNLTTDYRILEELTDLLEENQPTDLVLIFQHGKELHLHKSVLAFRSAFYDNLGTQVSVNNNDNEKIELDFDYEVCKELVQYLYTGKIPSVDKFGDKLLEAADWFGLEEVKMLW